LIKEGNENSEIEESRAEQIQEVPMVLQPRVESPEQIQEIPMVLQPEVEEEIIVNDDDIEKAI